MILLAEMWRTHDLPKTYRPRRLRVFWVAVCFWARSGPSLYWILLAGFQTDTESRFCYCEEKGETPKKHKVTNETETQNGGKRISSQLRVSSSSLSTVYKGEEFFLATFFLVIECLRLLRRHYAKRLQRGPRFSRNVTSRSVAVCWPHT